MSSLDRRSFVAAATASVAAWPGLTQSARIVVDGLDTSVIDDDFVALARGAGVAAVHKTLYRPDSFREFGSFAAARPDRVVVASSVEAILDARRRGALAFVLGAQSAGGPYGSGLDDAVTAVPLGSLGALGPALRERRQLGLMIQGLCYNAADLFGGGCLDHGVSLSRAGRRLVEAIHREAILLDVGGHTGERTSLDALEISTGRPVVCTHTNFARLNPNMRCISDRLAEAIAATGGVIGLTAISDFLVRNPRTAASDGPVSPTAPLEVLLDHFDHGRKLVGADHLGLGPDFLRGQPPVDVRPDDTVLFDSASLSAGPVRTVRGFEHIGQVANLIAGLERRGWRGAELDAVLGGNWLRVYRAAWGR